MISEIERRILRDKAGALDYLLGLECSVLDQAELGYLAHLGVMYSSLELLRKLVESGLDVNVLDERECPLIHHIFMDVEDSIALEMFQILDQGDLDVNMIWEIGRGRERNLVSICVERQKYQCLSTILEKPLKEDIVKRAIRYAVEKQDIKAISLIRDSSQSMYLNEPMSSGDNAVTPLILAASLGYLDVVKALVESNVEIDRHDVFEHKTALGHAVVNNHLDIVDYLIERGSNVNFGFPVRLGRLIEDAANTSYEMLKKFIDSGADIPVVNLGENRLFPVVIRKGDLRSLKILLDHLDSETLEKELEPSDLIYSVYHQNTEILDCLLDVFSRFSDQSKVEASKERALERALSKNQDLHAIRLLGKSARVTKEALCKAIQHEKFWGIAFIQGLMVKISFEDRGCLIEVLKAIAKISVHSVELFVKITKDRLQGVICEELAKIAVSDLRLLELLVSEGILRVNDLHGFGEQYTLLQYAVRSRGVLGASYSPEPIAEAKVDFLLSEGADPNLGGDIDVLGWAARSGSFKIIKKLLDKNADPNRSSVLFSAILYREKDPRVIQMLLAAGANPQVVKMELYSGFTVSPFVYACLLNRDKKILNLLSQNGRKPYVQLGIADDGLDEKFYPLSWRENDGELDPFMILKEYPGFIRFVATAFERGTLGVSDEIFDIWAEVVVFITVIILGNAKTAYDILLEMAKHIHPNHEDEGLSAMAVLWERESLGHRHPSESELALERLVNFEESGAPSYFEVGCRILNVLRLLRENIPEHRLYQNAGIEKNRVRVQYTYPDLMAVVGQLKDIDIWNKIYRVCMGYRGIPRGLTVPRPMGLEIESMVFQNRYEALMRQFKRRNLASIREFYQCVIVSGKRIRGIFNGKPVPFLPGLSAEMIELILYFTLPYIKGGYLKTRDFGSHQVRLHRMYQVESAKKLDVSLKHLTITGFKNI